MTSTLFSPVTLSGVTFPNRVVISPMCQYSAPEGAASDWHMAHLGQFAMSRAGLLLLEATAVEPAGRISPLCLALYSDAQEAALARVVTMLRYAGGEMPLGIQLGHAGRKGSCHMPWDGGHGLTAEEGGWPIVGPSALPYDDRRAVPDALDEAGMERIVAAFVDAARRADRIGFDVVEYHCAHGYLLHSFLSARSNRRQDGYGGSLENRMRFPLAVARRLREAWPARKALGARLDAEDATDAISLAETIAYARELKAIGFDYVCLSRGSLSGDQKIVSWPGYLLPLAATLRKATGMVTQAVGLIVDPRMAEDAVASGQVDMVALARGFLDDPRWVWHAAEALGAELAYPPQYRGADPSLWKGATLRPRAYAAG